MTPRQKKKSFKSDSQNFLWPNQSKIRNRNIYLISMRITGNLSRKAVFSVIQLSALLYSFTFQFQLTMVSLHMNILKISEIIYKFSIACHSDAFPAGMWLIPFSSYISHLPISQFVDFLVIGLTRWSIAVLIQSIHGGLISPWLRGIITIHLFYRYLLNTYLKILC